MGAPPPMGGGWQPRGVFGRGGTFRDSGPPYTDWRGEDSYRDKFSHPRHYRGDHQGGTTGFRWRDRRDRERGRRRAADDLDEEDDDLLEGCYSVSAEDEEQGKTQKGAKRNRDDSDDSDFEDYDYSPVRRRYHDNMEHHYRRRYYGPNPGEETWSGLHGVRDGYEGRDYWMDRGNRPDSRYYGPDSRDRKDRKPVVEEAPYEGPTIFDKVFKTKKREELFADGGKGDSAEGDWKRLKEKTEAKIRKEREKLERCERRIRKLQNGEEGKKRRDDDSKRKKTRGDDDDLPRAYQTKELSGEDDKERNRDDELDEGGSPLMNTETEGCETNVDPY